MRCTAAALLIATACAPPPPPAPKKVPTTYRMIGGLSMGAIGSAAIGFRHPQTFDAIAALGGPLDAALLLRTIDQFQTGGFCPRAELEARLATLNDPAQPACATHPPPLKYEHVQDFNHWKYTPTAPFDRTGNVGLLTDLTTAFGNLFTENAASTFAPPGVDEARMRRPPADFCTNPVRVKGLKNREYNPDGKYDAITFCDGEPTTWFCAADQTVVDFCSDPKNVATPLPAADEAAFAAAFCASKGGPVVGTRLDHPVVMRKAGGRFDPCRLAAVPMQVALAWDLNGNGRRDYGEPMVNNGQERFDDVGADGCANAKEDGKGGCTASAATGDPNHDDYDADARPLGTEGNWRFDSGEPFSDDGLDGVPASQDFGEGNGRFDVTEGRRRLFAHDPRSILVRTAPSDVARLNLLLDGGIRDLFNFGLTAHQVWGLWKHLRPDDTAKYRDHAEIPGLADARGVFKPWTAGWKRAPHNFEVLYGKEDATEAELNAGDGEHVGTTGQSINRISTLFNVAAVQWPSLPKPKAPLGGSSFAERQRVEWFDSAALGAKRGYGLFLPPGYDLPENASVRYPVLYLLHGYLGEPRQILASTFLADTYMKDSDVLLRPMIVVAPSGACCFVEAATGARDCREEDDAGLTYMGRAGWARECVGGSFFVDQTSGPGKYEASFFELMAAIDAKYRTLPAADVDAR